MQKKYEENLKKVKKITDEFDNFEIKESEAKAKFDEANELLNECIKILEKKNNADQGHDRHLCESQNR
jgi:exonuclease VII small subunit